ncbi:hypothetical protein P6709_15305 [Jeotgalibacillus sp. ET6]|uniref:hypothetical protein n=1 Tax=Jeotgalibacillus sp. ET6 TaxID=3037260 RepID=UPI0024188E76|nr:hypothetical protein [Jeotgalibacillus sp. ET6]MDG5473119.1 hypothetical protein [Jeotgalibacillus sp. ET6]
MFSNSASEVGANISNAVHVLKETYKNLNKLFSELDRVGEVHGFNSITPKFLRWKSDSNPEGWLTSNFIKLYQQEGNTPLKHLPNMFDEDVFGIEVDLEGEENFPVISIVKFKFDFAIWTRTPATSDHSIFWDPFRNERFFTITKENELWTSQSTAIGKSRYWGLEKAVAIGIPLLAVNSPEDISEKIFEKMKLLEIN